MVMGLGLRRDDGLGENEPPLNPVSVHEYMINDEY